MFITLENVVEKVTYTQFEIIFWYSALALTIVIFIIYLVTKKSNRKKLISLANGLEKKVNLLEKYTQENNLKKSKELLLNINLTLSRLESLFMELKASTMLSDFDILISLREDLSLDIKETLRTNVFNNLVNDLKVFVEKIKSLEIYVK